MAGGINPWDHRVCKSKRGSSDIDWENVLRPQEFLQGQGGRAVIHKAIIKSLFALCMVIYTPEKNVPDTLTGSLMPSHFDLGARWDRIFENSTLTNENE